MKYFIPVFLRFQSRTIFLSAFFALACFPSVVRAQTFTLRVSVLTLEGQPLQGARVEVRSGETILASGLTSQKGEIEFDRLKHAFYSLLIAKEGFETLRKQDVGSDAGRLTLVEVVLPQSIALKDEVEVKATDTTRVDPIEQGASPATSLGRTQAKDSTNRPDTVSDTLPLLPGIVRTDQGELFLFGAGESRSALLVNNADATDPATGQFGVTVPIDSVETINVFRTPYLAEYGRFTAGVVSVDTRRGGEKWNFELNDPFPEFRIFSGRLRGIREASPRLTFNGPLLKDKLYLSQGIEYDLAKRRVLALTFPNNETVSEAVNSFTQLDYLISASHSLTATFHATPRKARFFNLNFFNPRPVTPNYSQEDYSGTLVDRWTLGKHLLESLVAVKLVDQRVWPQRPGEMILTPTRNSGSYFNEQERDTSRVEWLESLTLSPIQNLLGAHNLKFGLGVAHAINQGIYQARSILTLNTAGQLLRRIDFVGGAPYRRRDTELILFGQNHLIASPRLAVDVGVRFERQAITSVMRIMPRVGFAWRPFSRLSTVMRMGYGLFYDRVPLNVFAFDNYPEQVVTRYSPQGAVLDGPRRFLNLTEGGAARRSLFSFRGTNPGNFAPYSSTWNVEVEHPVTRALRLRIGYQSSNSQGLIFLQPMISDAVNAMVLSGNGQSRYRHFETTLRLELGKEQELFFSYVRSRSRGDLNEYSQYLGGFPVPIIRPNFRGNLTADLPNRFLAWGQVRLPWNLRWAPLCEFRTGSPYFILDAEHQYVGRPNTDALRFPKFFAFDSRFTRDFEINKPLEKLFGLKLQDKYLVRASLSGFNFTQHFNPTAFRNNLADPQFGLFFGQNRRRFRLDFDILF